MKRDVPWSSLTRYDALERLCKSKSSCCLVSCRHTKPLTFADCIGDELPLGWEEAYDPQVGAYYVDHNTSKFYIDLYLDRSTSCFFFAYVDVRNNSAVECFKLYYRLYRSQRALSWRTRGCSGSVSRSSCCASTST